jgi:anti-sigma B factor antagonist
MTVKVAHKNGVTVLTPHGRIDANGSAVLAQSIYRTLSHKNTPQKMSIDFHDVTKVRNTGLMLLLEALATIKRKGGRAGVINVSSHVRNLLVISSVVSHFEHFDSENEALSSLAT